jgi:hypothetical protein
MMTGGEVDMMMMLTPLLTMFLQISAINVTYIFILCRSEHMNNMFSHFDNNFGNYNYTRQRHIYRVSQEERT